MPKSVAYIIPLLYLGLLGTVQAKITSSADKIITHKLEVFHKGLSESGKTPLVLYQVQNPLKHADYFYANVESVVCGSEVCEIVEVTLFWNALGRFTHYELADGINLEKEEGDPFLKEDYQKLHSILRNPTSALKNLYSGELVEKVEDNALDALSGATINIGEAEVINGAIWTCYTLWHWANGDVATYVRNTTAKQYSNKTLRDMLVHGNISYRLFAIEELTKRKIYDSETSNAIVNALKVNSKLNTQGLGYFEGCTAVMYYKNILLLLENNQNEKSRLVFLNNVQNTKFKASKDFYETLSHLLHGVNTYEEVNSILRILEENATISEDLVKNVMPLLTNEEFLIARRAYWFLKNLSLKGTQQENLRAFHEAYADRL